MTLSPPAPSSSAHGAAPRAAAPARWPLPIRAVHWVTALLVAGAFAAVLLHDAVDDKALHARLMGWHQQAGVLVLALTGLRMLLRLISRRPADDGSDMGASRLPARLAAAVHGLLYLGLLALPLLGWAMTSALGHPPVLFGWHLPGLLGKDRDLAESIQDWHETIGWVLLALVAAHAAAAVWHHRVLRDNVLRRML